MKNMEYNFQILLERIINTLDVSDLNQIYDKLQEIQTSVLCVGSGGSSVVSEFASIIFNQFNGCASKTLDPRDLLYHNNDAYKNVFISSYSGKNYGVETACENNCTKYLFSTNNLDSNIIKSITYNSSLEKEKSFISLGATIMPMSILLSYCQKNNAKNIIKEVYIKCCNLKFDLNVSTNYDVLTGNDSRVASKFLESTFTEAGLGNVVLHNKYDFCHGRTTLPFHEQNRTLIFLKTDNSDLTKLELKWANNLYHQIITLESFYHDPILSNFDLTMQAMFLSKYIATLQQKDLSDVRHAEAAKELYSFEGSM